MKKHLLVFDVYVTEIRSCVWIFETEIRVAGGLEIEMFSVK